MAYGGSGPPARRCSGAREDPVRGGKRRGDQGELGCVLTCGREVWNRPESEAGVQLQAAPWLWRTVHLGALGTFPHWSSRAPETMVRWERERKRRRTLLRAHLRLGTIGLVGIEIGDGGGGLLRGRQRSDGGVMTRIGSGALAQVGGAAPGHAGLGGVAQRTTAPGGGARER